MFRIGSCVVQVCLRFRGGWGWRSTVWGALFCTWPGGGTCCPSAAAHNGEGVMGSSGLWSCPSSSSPPLTRPSLTHQMYTAAAKPELRLSQLAFSSLPLSVLPFSKPLPLREATTTTCELGTNTLKWQVTPVSPTHIFYLGSPPRYINSSPSIFSSFFAFHTILKPSEWMTSST